MKGHKPDKPGSKMNIASTIPEASGTLSPGVQDVIGKQLRAMYEDLVKQEVPDRFTELLKKLDKRDHEGDR